MEYPESRRIQEAAAGIAGRFDLPAPADIVEAYRDRGRLTRDGGMVFVHDGDMDMIATPIDFLGLNYYTSLRIGAGGDESEDTGQPESADPPLGYTEMGWPITPHALTDYLRHLSSTYAPRSIVITETPERDSDSSSFTS